MFEITYYIDGWHGSWNSITISAAKLDAEIAEIEARGDTVSNVRPW